MSSLQLCSEEEMSRSSSKEYPIIEKSSDQSRKDTVELTNEDETHNIFQLSYFHSSLFATILEDTITEIRILSECNNTLRLLKTGLDIVPLRAQKFGVARPAVKDELDGINPKDLWKEEYKLDKFVTDRNFIYDSLFVTYLDLALNRSYQGLTKQVGLVLKRNSHYATLVEEDAKNRLTRREVAKQLRLQRNHITSANYDMDVIIDNLNAQLEDVSLVAEARSRYVNKWERSRVEQHKKTILDKERPVFSNINDNKQKLDGEHRIHSEVMLLINININEAMDKVDKLMTKYDDDIEEMDLKLQYIKNNYQNAHDRRILLEAQYAKHLTEMQNWIQFKEDREKARLYHEKMTHAAIVAQAWWRGLLVRMQLGPYNPRKMKQLMRQAKKNKNQTKA